MLRRRRSLPLVVICGALAVPSVSSADIVMEIKLSPAGTTYSGQLGDHIESPGHDGGLVAFGWNRGDLTLLITFIGRDVKTVNGQRDDNLMGIGPGVRFDRAIGWRFSGWLRGGVEVVDLAGPMGTTLETAWGWDVNAGAGIGFRLLRHRDKGGEADIVVTAELITQAMRLYPDDGKRIDGHATGALFGVEVRSDDW